MRRNFEVLLISVDESIVTLCQSVLGSEGHLVAVVANVKQAISLLASSGKFNAVLVDTGNQSTSDQFLLEALTRKIDPSRIWIINFMGMSIWREAAERLSIPNALWRPLQRHDLVRVLDELRNDEGSPCVQPGNDGTLA